VTIFFGVIAISCQIAMQKEFFKLAILGDGGVGKSAIALRLISGSFIEHYDPTVEDSHRKIVFVDNSACLLEIVDTCGLQDTFAQLRDLLISQQQGFLMVYSITCRQSFHEIDTCREKTIRIINEDLVSMILVGNKCDMETYRQVTTEEGQKMANRFGCPFFETSAKTSVNVDKVFDELVRQMRSKVYPKSKTSTCTLL